MILQEIIKTSIANPGIVFNIIHLDYVLREHLALYT